MVQLNNNTHSLLRQYAKENGYSIKGLIHKMISERIGNRNIKIDPNKVIKSQPRMISSKFL